MEQPGRNIRLVTRDGGVEQAARSIVLAPWVAGDTGPVGPTIPPANLTSGSGVGGIGMGWIDAPQRAPARNTGWNDAPHLEFWAGAPYGEGTHKDHQPSQPWGLMPTRERMGRYPHEDFDALADGDILYPYQAPPAKDDGSEYPHGDFAQTADGDTDTPYLVPPAQDAGSGYPFHRTADYEDALRWDTRDYEAPAPAEHITLDAQLEGPYNPPDDPLRTHFPFGDTPPPGFFERPIMPTDTAMEMPVTAPRITQPAWRTGWGLGSWERPDPGSYINWVAEPPEEHTRPPAPPILGVYIYMPTISITTVPGGDQIEATQASLALDRDSFAWTISATVATQADLDLIRPDSNGPKEISIDINGHAWAALVESYSTSKSFGGATYSISARSKSVLLAEPYSRATSGLITQDYSAIQLAEQAVAGTGWTINWLAQDWVVSGGAYSYQQQSPIRRVAAIAAAIGAKVQPHPLLDRLDIVSQYPTSPSAWDTAPLDAILPESLIFDMSGRWSPGSEINRAIVAGSKTGGVLVNATRTGTAGDKMAAQVVDPLITAAIAGQERARVEMDKGGNWETVSITTTLGQQGDPAGPALILPQQLVEIGETAETWRGQAASVTITAAADPLKVRQSIELERRR